MSLPQVVSREEWLAARKELLAQEKELTRTRDALNAERRRLGMVKIDKDYVFEGPQGEVGLRDLFDGCRQLVIQHFMFDPRWEDGCPSCSWAADEISDGRLRHLQEGDTAFAAVSRAPLAKIEAFKARMGWRFPWVSSYGTDFNIDFSVFTEDERRSGAGFNFGTPRRADLNVRDSELHGLSAFALEDGAVYHTYSTYDRGTDVLSSTWQLLDRTPLGRDDENHPDWPRRRVEY